MTVTDERELEIRPVEPGELDTLQHIRALAFAPVFKSFRDMLGATISDVALASAEAEQAQELEKLLALERMTEAGMQVETVGTGGGPAHAPAPRGYQKAGFDASVPGFWMYGSL